MPLVSIAAETVGSSWGSPIWRAGEVDRDPHRGGVGVAATASSATLLQASSTTQRPIGTISWDSSATGMKEAGLVSPHSGWRQRSSASSATIEPSRRPTIGW